MSQKENVCYNNDTIKANHESSPVVSNTAPLYAMSQYCSTPHFLNCSRAKLSVGHTLNLISLKALNVVVPCKIEMIAVSNADHEPICFKKLV